MTFLKKEEDFICRVCGIKVKGTGYTNHCPNCLFSLHVDEEVPGDRASNCKGLMEPIRAEIESGKYILTHKCQKCKKVTKNKTSENDNFEEILKLF
ncbi:MAG: RNHCP domain-containing protein [Candidatus Woesebacteria bacterium]|nr:RNHCP domain-containing protein [Candidatus Woesebacteria bacterium]